MEEEKSTYRMEVNSDTGKAIAALRQHRGLSIKEAAAAADMTDKKLEAIERGNLPHNVHNLARIVEAMQGRLAIIPQESPDDPHCQFIELED